MVENGKNVELDPSNHHLNPPDIQVETFIIIRNSSKFFFIF